MPNQPTVGVILSGCGVFDGSEIHEAVATLLALDQRGAAVRCLAPSRTFDVIDHLTKQPTGEQRNTLTESARIARGQITDLAEVRGDEFDALALPGGFGAAKNLCTFAADGPDCSIDPHVERVLRVAHEAGKPLGFACIAPAVAARVFGELGITLTIGHDADTAAGLEKLGARHAARDVEDIALDQTQHIVSTPAYMEAESVKDVFVGIDKMIAQLLSWVREPAGV